MAGWVLVPCLVTLRDEFNRVSPNRDKGADGSIGDRAHAMSVSDHNPDESGATPYEDADNVDEVHAFDADCTGPWPDGKGGEAGAWFDRKIRAIAARERVEYQSATLAGRLQNIIWRGQIISRSWGWSAWQPYSGASKHFDHAHFSARYTTAQENDTRPWGVYEEADVAFADDKIRITETTGRELFEPDLKAGAEVDAATLLQLAAIHARRGAVSADAALTTAKAVAAGQAKMDERMAVLEDWLTKLSAPAGDEQTAALLHSVLGARSRAVGQILATFED